MFIPPHCPRSGCRNAAPPDETAWYRNLSPYKTLAFGMIPRFQCRACKKTFSKQTFSINYFAKKELNMDYIYCQINAGAGIRNTARSLNVRPETVINRIARMARNALIVHQIILDDLPINEDLVIDGFESFCGSQFFPDNYTIAVGKKSQFVYAWDYATIRRKGRMTPQQKLIRSDLEVTFKASPTALKKSFSNICRLIDSWTPRRKLPLILYTDEKYDYERALWRTKAFKQRLFCGDWRHHQTYSQEGRNTKNPLFAVNYIDREIRKDMANHKRETVQFSRNVNNAMLRMSLYFFDHNLVKPYRIRQDSNSSKRHAQVAGLDRGKLNGLIEGFYTRRFFRSSKGEFIEPIRKTLNREWVTPLKSGGDKAPGYLAT